MIDSKCRNSVQPLFDSLGKFLVYLKIKADTITVAAFIVGLFSSICIASDKPILAFVFLWLSGFLDVLDGSVARLTGKASAAGAYMDLIFDRMVEAFVILGFTFLAPSNYIAYIVFYISVIFNFTTFILAGALFKNTGIKSMHYDFGIAERTETFLVFSLMLLFNEHIFPILMVFNVIIFLTGSIRFIKVITVSKYTS